MRKNSTWKYKPSSTRARVMRKIQSTTHERENENRGKEEEHAWAVYDNAR